jgi:hypothetical protein
MKRAREEEEAWGTGDRVRAERTGYNVHYIIEYPIIT